MNLDRAFGIETKKVTVRGVEYTLQNMPFKEFYKMQERNRDAGGNQVPSGIYEEVFSNVVINPKVSWENFDDVDEIEELMVEAFRFLRRRESKTPQGEGKEAGQE